MTSEITHMGRAQPQHNQIIADGVIEDLFPDRNFFEQHNAQESVALTQMMTQFENQKHVEVRREASEKTHIRESIFRGEVGDMSGDLRSEEPRNMMAASEQYTKMMREEEAEHHRMKQTLDEQRYETEKLKTHVF